MGVIFDEDHDFEGLRSPRAHLDTLLRNLSSHLGTPRKACTTGFISVRNEESQDEHRIARSDSVVDRGARCTHVAMSGDGRDLKQLRQQLSITQRLHRTRQLWRARHGRRIAKARRRRHDRGDFVTYGRSRARPSTAARDAGTPAAASVSAAAGSRAGIYGGMVYES
eukprot:scaffold104486_cov69-Phaeocystis_antarctica.AAC.1